MLPSIQQQLADEAIERYVLWREACEALQSAYDAWQAAHAGERRLAGAAHAAALDREQAAAAGYAEAIEQLTTRQPA
jgi:hypothetical protein